ncbi:MAG: ferrochelatase [Flavobacteriales bacterium]|jgi:ferrochelatase
MKANTGVLLVNLGTPDSPKTSDVRKYLTQFLNDPRVIDIPWLLRKILVNLIIVPFRSSKSAAIYRKVWTDKGSPLLLFGQELKEKVQEELGDDVHVSFAMRYQSPSMDSVLEEMRLMNFAKIIIVPLYPQYASSSTGSTMQRIMEIVSKWYVIPELNIMSQFYDNEEFLDAVAERGAQYDLNDYDHVLFSYHGLPERQVDKVYADGLCNDRDCTHELDRENQFCYKAACYATTREIVKRLQIPEDKHTVCFQSRLDQKWIKPFSDDVVADFGDKGMKKLLVFSPAFVADCLETTIEIGDEYQEIFEEHGGEKVELVESLNIQPSWVKAVSNMIRKRL